MTMICGRCGQYGIHWKGPYGNLTHTECPHCGGINCQQSGEEEEYCAGCGERGCGGRCAGDDMMGDSA